MTDDKKLKPRVAQMPYADKFQLHIYAALAEQERTFISQRTKAALKAARARGVKLRGARDATMRRNVVVRAKASAAAKKAMGVIGPLKASGQSLNAIAGTLHSMGVATSRGGRWTAKQVSRVLERTA